MGRFPSSDEASSLKKGPWTPEEDKKLVDYITKNGHGCWRALPKLAGLNRCGKSCRLRWTNYLRPDIKRGKFSEDEERIIINLHSSLGNKWSKIANHLPRRTDNEIKNYWNTSLRKKLLQMGIDPNTHKPRTDLNPILNLSQLLSSSHLSNLIRNISTSNSTTHHNTWANNSLNLQAQMTTDQLLKIQLFQNLISVATSTSFLGPQNLNSLLEAYTIANRSTISSTGHETQNPGFVHCEPSQAIITDDSSSWECKNSAKAVEGIIHEETIDPLPNLVSDLPLTIQMENNKDTSYEPNSTIFEAWDKLFENGETSESYWKDILELMSNSPTP